MSRSKIYEQKIKKIYNKFLKTNKINTRSGYFDKDIKLKFRDGSSEDLKFAAYPFIGLNYWKSKPRILFIGAEVPSDSKEDILDIGNRRKLVKQTKERDYNSHLAGTYICALYFLQEEFAKKWKKKEWKNIKDCRLWKNALLKLDYPKKSLLTKKNPLDYIAITNRHKFVHKMDTKGFSKALKEYCLSNKTNKPEEDLLFEEIDALDPDLIVFQGKFKSKDKSQKKKWNPKKRVVYDYKHPSSLRFSPKKTTIEKFIEELKKTGQKEY